MEPFVIYQKVNELTQWPGVVLSIRRNPDPPYNATYQVLQALDTVGVDEVIGQWKAIPMDRIVFSCETLDEALFKLKEYRHAYIRWTDARRKQTLANIKL